MITVFLSRSECQTSQVVQWLRSHQPMQRMWVRSLFQEDPTGLGATKPAWHDCWACALEPVLCNKRSHLSEKPEHSAEEKPPHSTPRESPLTATETQRGQKWMNKYFFKKEMHALAPMLSSLSHVHAAVIWQLLPTAYLRWDSRTLWHFGPVSVMCLEINKHSFLRKMAPFLQATKPSLGNNYTLDRLKIFPFIFKPGKSLWLLGIHSEA